MQENIRILFVIDNLQCGGAQKIISFLANGLPNKNYKSAVCSYASSEIHFELGKNIEVFFGSGYEGKTFFRHLKKIRFIKQTIIVYKPDIIIAFSAIPTILSMFASKKHIPVVYCERMDPYQAKRIRDKLEYSIVKKASWFVFQTKEAMQYFGKKVIAKCSVIHNPVTATYKTQCALDGRKKSIVFVGRFENKQKRQDVMVEAFAKIHAKYPEWTLDFYGDGEDLQFIKDLVTQKQISEYVFFKGVQKNIEDVIRDYGIYVLTSDYEGIPNTLIEAMCVGLPVIATDCSPGGARLLIENDHNGILISRGNVDKLVEKISFLIFTHKLILIIILSS